MYGNHGHPERDALGPCVRNLEKEAKNLKKKLDRFTIFKNVLEIFLTGPDSYYVDSNEERRLLFAIFGSLSVDLPEMEKNYESLLEEMAKA